MFVGLIFFPLQIPILHSLNSLRFRSVIPIVYWCNCKNIRICCVNVRTCHLFGNGKLKTEGKH